MGMFTACSLVGLIIVTTAVEGTLTAATVERPLTSAVGHTMVTLTLGSAEAVIIMVTPTLGSVDAVMVIVETTVDSH